MQNTDCFRSFDKKTRKISILGKDLYVKNYICSSDGIHYKNKPDNVKIKMSICPTSYCNAKCKFCFQQEKSNDKIDILRLGKVLRELKKEDRILCVTFTGGEPFLYIELLDEALTMVFEILGKSAEVSINTNGCRLSEMNKLKYLSYVDTIHISRHHYDDRINDELFGMKMPTGDELREIISSVSYRDIFVLNCLLMKDYIGTPDEAHRYLDFAIDIGASKVSFITCSPATNYAAQQRIEFEDVIKKDDSSLLFTRNFRDFNICHCSDGVYTSGNGDLMEFYGRSTSMKECGYCRGITYGADNFLRSGYNGEVII